MLTNHIKIHHRFLKVAKPQHFKPFYSPKSGINNVDASRVGRGKTHFSPGKLAKRAGRLALVVLTTLTLIGLNMPRASASTTSFNWLQFGFDQQHSGNNTLESKINRGNVANLTQKFKITLSDGSFADGAPVYLSNVTTVNGVEDLLFLTTSTGDLIALDAESGAQVWLQQNAAPSCTYSTGVTNLPCYTNSSPAIDPSLQYIYTYGMDGKIHKYQVGDGTQITTGGWPEVATLKNGNEKGASALSIATDRSGTSYLYATTSSYFNDLGDYQGHVTAINLATGTQNVFNTLCSDHPVHFTLPAHGTDCGDVQAAIWSRPGTIYDPDTDKIYIAAGNGRYDSAHHSWADSVLALHTDGTGVNGNPVDAYTPSNQSYLNANDYDLGSTAPAILPANGGHHYAVQGGKDTQVRILDMDNLSGSSGFGNPGGEIPGSVLIIPSNGSIKAQPAVWTNPVDGRVWVFVGSDLGINGLLLNAAGNGWITSAGVTPTSWSREWSGFTSPVVANGVLFGVYDRNIVALDPTTGTTLWTATIGNIHWQSPIVANGVVYIADQSDSGNPSTIAGHLTAFWLGATTTFPNKNTGIYNSGAWWLRNTDGTNFGNFGYGASGWIPVVGDWDGDDVDSIGIYKDGAWYLLADDNTTLYASFFYGGPGWLPVVGDWSGSGATRIGIYQDGSWYLRNNLSYGPADYSFFYGAAGWLPVTGKWNGSNRSGMGIYQDGSWYLRNSLSYGPADYSFFYGASGWLPVTGDWIGNRQTGMGIYQNGSWYLRNSLSYGTPDFNFFYGDTGWTPVTGDWNGPNEDTGSRTVGTIGQSALPPVTPPVAPVTPLPPTFQPPTKKAS